MNTDLRTAHEVNDSYSWTDCNWTGDSTDSLSPSGGHITTPSPVGDKKKSFVSN